jgi:hypothetical protein
LWTLVHVRDAERGFAGSGGTMAGTRDTEASSAAPVRPGRGRRLRIVIAVLGVMVLSAELMGIVRARRRARDVWERSRGTLTLVPGTPRPVLEATA